YGHNIRLLLLFNSFLFVIKNFLRLLFLSGSSFAYIYDVANVFRVGSLHGDKKKAELIRPGPQKIFVINPGG
ncbi:MAG: hypothetical protein L6437_09190, partial [Kiritimatiellae bacterium]|nr:hypothetical protein [Kiritimatiellia bacterium]